MSGDLIVVSFYAPRFEKWPGCGTEMYDHALDILDASCKRLGLRHICISDEPRPRVETFLCKLPRGLMSAIIDGQRQWLDYAPGPTLFTGADCLLTADPRHVAGGYDMAITTKSTTNLNTGAIWCMDGKTCVPVWRAASKEPLGEWGMDQMALLKAFRASGLRILELPCDRYNRKPHAEMDAADGYPMVVHFKGGPRKRDMSPFWHDFLAQQRAAA